MTPEDIANAPIIGITGRAGAGKTTTANWFLRNHKNVIKYSFASPLKTMMYELVRYTLPSKWPVKAAEYINNPDLKEQPMPFLAGQTPRRLMQTLGTEWGRMTVAPDFWVRLAQNRVERQLGHTFHSREGRTVAAVFDDVRFANEAEMIRDYKGCILRIERPGESAAAGHVSEAMPFDADVTIVNDGSEEDLIARLAVIWPPTVQPKA
jgi:hypothetical protein